MYTYAGELNSLNTLPGIFKICTTGQIKIRNQHSLIKWLAINHLL